VTPIAARTRPGSAATSWPATRTWPASAGSRVDRIWTMVVFPDPFGPEQGVHRALGDVQVDAVEDQVVTERLAQRPDHDRRPGPRAGLGRRP
jgi:hypothetical protein